MNKKNRLTANEAHRIACAAMAEHPGIRELLSRFGDTLGLSLVSPSDEEPNFVELVLIGESSLLGEGPKAEHVDDPRERTLQLAACSVSPVTGEVQIVIEEDPKVVHPANKA